MYHYNTSTLFNIDVVDRQIPYQNISFTRILLLSLSTTSLITNATIITIYHENSLSYNLLSPAKLCKRNASMYIKRSKGIYFIHNHILTASKIAGNDYIIISLKCNVQVISGTSASND